MSTGTDGANNGSKRDVFIMDFRLDINFGGLGLFGRMHFLIKGSSEEELITLETRLVILVIRLEERSL